MKTKITPHQNDFITNRIAINKLLSLIFLFFTLLTVSLFSQVHEDWVQRYNGPVNSVDEAASIAVDGSGNVYVTGWSWGNDTSEDYVTIKYNSSGVQQWFQRYNGSGNANDEASSIAVDGSGNVYVTGYSAVIGSGYDYTTIKYNTTGVQQWVQRYNGPGNADDWATAIAIDGSGNVYVTGSSLGNGTDMDYATIKYNSNGVQQWVQRYNGPIGNGIDEANSIAVDGTGNVYFTGKSIGNGTGGDYATIKYNTNGVQQWVQRYNGPTSGDDAANSIAVDGSGNVYVTGNSEGDYATIKYNSNGTQEWIQRYSGSGNSYDAANSIAVDGSGNAYVTGTSDGDYATIKYNANGVQDWVQRYNGPGNGDDEALCIAIDGYGNVYVTGYSFGSGTRYDYATLKYNSSGVQQWVQRYNGPGNGEDWAHSIAVDGSGNVYVTGGSTGIGTAPDYATIKYSQPIGIKQISSEVPDKYALYQNYPNPFNPSTKIKFEIPDFPLSKGVRGMNVRLTIYDLLGREVTTLVNEQLKPGTYEVEWDASSYASGVYFYRLETSDYVETKKMLMLK
jgi:uncharacterized delta-60 repeat protein